MSDRPLRQAADALQDEALLDQLTRFAAGEMSADEMDALHERLADDPAAQDALILITMQAESIRQLAGTTPRVIARPDTSATRVGTRPNLAIPLALAAALLLAAGVVAIYVVVISEHRTSNIEDRTSSTPIATLIDATDTVFVDDTLANPGGEYAPGVYSLESGSAQFLLRNRVTVDLSGRTRLTVYNPDSVYLARGDARFNVPDGATGFTVHLPDRSRIVDLGTAFRVELDDAGHAELRVTEGRVAWTARDGVEPVIVAAGQTARLVDGRVALSANPGLVAYWPLNDGPAGSTVTGADDVIDDPDHPATDATSEGSGDTWVDDAERGVVLSTTSGGNLIAGTQGITGDFTWSLWIKTDADTSHVIMGNRSGSSPWNRLTPTMTQNWATIGDDRKGTSFGVADGEWHHLVYRRAGDVVSVWVDGRQYADTAKQSEPFDGPMRIGGDALFKQRLTGLLSDVAVWDIALDETRIKALAAGGPVVLAELWNKTSETPTRSNESADRSDGHRETEGPSSEK